MELWKEILAHYLSSEQAHIVFPNLNLDCSTIVEGVCYQLCCRSKKFWKTTVLKTANVF